MVPFQVSVLSDTAAALEEKGRKRVIKSMTSSISEDSAHHERPLGGHIAVMATIDKLSYSSIPPKVVGYFHHWVDAIAAIEPVKSEGRHAIDDADGGTVKANYSQWKLAFKSAGVSASAALYRESSFAFRVSEIQNGYDELDREASHEISWNV